MTFQGYIDGVRAGAPVRAASKDEALAQIAARYDVADCDGKWLTEHGETLTVEVEKCGHIALGSRTFVCDLPKGHKGWHGESVKLRSSTPPFDRTVTSTTNWGDDGLAPHASKTVPES